MKKILLLLLALPLFSFGQENNLYHITDTNFLAFLQEVHPEVIVNDSLDVITATVLTSLHCHNREIENLDGLQYFTSLQDLVLASNQLTVLPELPDGLIELHCASNQLTVLPELPDGLSYLNCSSNPLTVLPELPDGLANLHCASNQLTVLPELPDGLTYFNCGSNPLTVLPELPDGLTYLNCSSNPLTVLPELPDGLTYLYCASNQLTVLPELPETLNTIALDATEIECVQYYPEQLEEQLGGYPICIEGCIDSSYYNFSDTVQVDDGTCYPFITGCTDSTAYNYPELIGDEFVDVNTTDGSCISFQYMVDSLAQLNTIALDSISGLQVELETWNTSIELTEGWNMIGYGCSNPTDLVVAMYAYEGFILIMKDNNGQVYMPEFGFNGIGDLTPGYGYQLKVTDYILDFNICE